MSTPILTLVLVVQVVLFYSLRSDLAALRSDIAALRSDIAALRTDTALILRDQVAELRGQVAELRGHCWQVAELADSLPSSGLGMVRGFLQDKPEGGMSGGPVLDVHCGLLGTLELQSAHGKGGAYVRLGEPSVQRWVAESLANATGYDGEVGGGAVGEVLILVGGT